MAAGAAKPVIEVEVPESGVEVVPPHQGDDAATEPDAFRVAGRPVDRLLGFDEFVGFPLIILGTVRSGGGSLTLILRGRVAALGKSSRAEQEGKRGNGEVTQDHMLNLKHPSTHTFPD